MAEATNTPNPSDPHPYAFAGLQEARQALRWHMLAAEKAGFQDLRRVTDTMGAFALAISESGTRATSASKAWQYLANQLEDVTGDIEEWSEHISCPSSLPSTI